MKKIFAIIPFLLFAAFSINAAAPSLSTIDNIEYQLVKASTATVTATGQTAQTIITKESVEPGWTYVITVYDSIGAAADSAHLGIIMYGSNKSTAMYTADFASLLTATTADVHVLPIGVTAFGGAFSVTFTRTNATNVSKIYRWELYKVRRNEIKQDWNTRR